MAGCLSAPADDPGASGIKTQEPREYATGAMTTGPALYLNQCQSAIFGTEVPKAILDWPERSTWHEQTRPAHQLLYLAFFCDRVGWGELERGPVFLLLEGSRAWEYPEPCAPTNPGVAAILYRLYSDDAELAEGLGTAMGVAWFESSFAWSHGGPLPGDESQLSWTPNGYPESVWTAGGLHQVNSASSGEITWLAHNASASSRLVLEQQHDSHNFMIDNGRAAFEAPSLLSHGPDIDYYTQQTMLLDSEAVGTLTMWADPQCGS